MKKYEKPEIVFEDFSLSINIAVGCEHIHNHALLTCPIDDIEGTGLIKPKLFSLGVTGTQCNKEGNSDSATNDGICYHVPTESNNLFTSQ